MNATSGHAARNGLRQPVDVVPHLVGPLHRLGLEQMAMARWYSGVAPRRAHGRFTDPCTTLHQGLRESVAGGRLAPYQMGAEQALARLANIATLDVRELFDEEGELLPVPDWPDSVRSYVEGFSADGGKFTLESWLRRCASCWRLPAKCGACATGSTPWPTPFARTRHAG